MTKTSTLETPYVTGPFAHFTGKVFRDLTGEGLTSIQLVTEHGMPADPPSVLLILSSCNVNRSQPDEQVDVTDEPSAGGQVA